MDSLLVTVVVAVAAILFLRKLIIVVPQQEARVIERLGKYSRTLSAGFYILMPFVDRVAYRHTLKEQSIDIPEQLCITRDNVQVGVDGVLYMQILDAERASYGISDYEMAIIQLAQTTLRSEVGKIDLDKTFEERSSINFSVVSELDKASDPWGVKVLRYEIKNINPPRDVLDAMEKQMRAEREKRAAILTSEGMRDSNINEAEGHKQKVIKESEANKQLQINEAEGEGQAILTVANATAEGVRAIGVAIKSEGGDQAVQASGGRTVHRNVRQPGQAGQQPDHSFQSQRYQFDHRVGHDRDQARPVVGGRRRPQGVCLTLSGTRPRTAPSCPQPIRRRNPERSDTMSNRPKIAAITTIYHPYAHAQHIVDRFLEGYGWAGRHHYPPMDLVSLYVDQVREKDLSRGPGRPVSPDGDLPHGCRSPHPGR